MAKTPKRSSEIQSQFRAALRQNDVESLLVFLRHYHRYLPRNALSDALNSSLSQDLPTIKKIWLYVLRPSIGQFCGVDADQFVDQCFFHNREDAAAMVCRTLNKRLGHLGPVVDSALRNNDPTQICRWNQTQPDKIFLRNQRTDQSTPVYNPNDCRSLADCVLEHPNWKVFVDVIAPLPHITDFFMNLLAVSYWKDNTEAFGYLLERATSTNINRTAIKAITPDMRMNFEDLAAPKVRMLQEFFATTAFLDWAEYVDKGKKTLAMDKDPSSFSLGLQRFNIFEALYRYDKSYHQWGELAATVHPINEEWRSRLSRFLLSREVPTLSGAGASRKAKM